MAALAESNVSYEQLFDIEREFQDVETEIIRKQYELSKPIYEKRQALLAQIPNFWSLVLEQAPPDIDEFIQPLDANLLLASLKSISVSRFELDEQTPGGDPRSVAIKFEFNENEHFEDKVIEKKFWYRHADKGDFSALVSEPVTIKWKDPKKDLTDGLLDLVKKVWDEDPEAFRPIQESERAKDADAKGKDKKEKRPLTEAQKTLREKIDNIGLGAVSFFAFFGYVGRRVSHEESQAAIDDMRKDMAARKAGKPTEVKKDEDEDMDIDDEEDDEDERDFEIFAPGDDLAHAIVEDLWPDALKYFTQAQELEEFDDMEMESDESEDEDEKKA